MAFDKGLQNVSQYQSFLAGGAIVKRRFVKLQTTGDHAVVAVSAATDSSPIGVAQHDAASGEVVTVAMAGSIAVEAGGAVARGEKVQLTSNGRVDDTTTAGNTDVGIALDVGSAAGDLIQVLFRPELA